MLNLTYIPECSILPGRTEQWNWGVIWASSVALEKCLPSVWLTIVNQPGWRQKRGLKNIFAITQVFTQLFDLAEMSVKWIAPNDSVNTILTASASLAPLVSAGGSCGLKWIASVPSKGRARGTKMQIN